MRVWDCDPRLLCDKHLRAQHAEIHFAIRVVENGWRTRWKDVERFRSVSGLTWLEYVHDATVVELKRRGLFGTHRPVQDVYWPDDETEWLDRMCAVDYPPTELNQGTPWERDGVSFEWYRAHEKDWTRELARQEAKRHAAAA